jgi:hypothetical protein
MGQWGTPETRKARHRAVAVRRKQAGSPYLTAPNREGWVEDLYPKWLNDVWEIYEGAFIGILRALRSRSLAPGEEDLLLIHIAALKPRKVTFLDDLNAYQVAHDLPPLTTRDLPYERLAALVRTLPYIETWRWRVIEQAQGERFILNDRGLCEFSETDSRTGFPWPGHGVFIPLGPALGVVGFLHEPGRHRRRFRPRDFTERLSLNRGHAARLNFCLWDDAESFVVAHPDDLAALANVGSGAPTRLSTAAPYRFRGHGFFGD